MKKTVTRFVASWPELIYFHLRGPVMVLVALLLVLELSQHTVRTIAHYLVADLDQSTEGIILRSDVKGGGKYSAYRSIVYSYVVDDRTYISSMIDYTQRTYLPKEYVAQYSKGDKIEVLYDSRFPRLSLIEHSDFNFRLIVNMVAAILLFTVCLSWRIWVSGPMFESNQPDT